MEQNAYKKATEAVRLASSALSLGAYLAVSSNDADQMRMDGAWQLRDKTHRARAETERARERAVVGTDKIHRK